MNSAAEAASAVVADSPLPGCSIVVEWENTRHVHAARTHRMLQLLAAQAARERHGNARKVELLIAYDPAEADGEEIQQQLQQNWTAAAGGIETRLAAVPASSYYVLKNRCAAMAKHEIVVFIDCDVLPQPGWLQQLLAPFESPAIGVSQGATYVTPHNAWTSGLALAWLFPFQLADGSLSETERIVANNIAFRRSVLLQFPYPELPTWRGQCTTQRQSLDKAGVGVHWASAARVEHPFPEGLAGVVERACLNAHDHVTRAELAGAPPRDWKASYWRFRSLLKRSAARREQLLRSGAKVHAGPWTARAVACLYWGVGLFSECMVHLAPHWWRRQLRELPRQPEAAGGGQHRAV